MSERAVRIRPLSKRELDIVRALYRAGDAFRDAEALAERFNVTPKVILDVVNYRYSKGRKS